MHIHGSMMNVQAANPFSAAQGGQGAERAREVRKRVLESGQSAEAGASTAVNPDGSPEAQVLVNQWLDSRHSQVLTGHEQEAAESGRVSEFG